MITLYFLNIILEEVQSFFSLLVKDTTNKQVVLFCVYFRFRCRQCYDLIYRSSRESHKWDNMWWSLGIDPKVGKI